MVPDIFLFGEIRRLEPSHYHSVHLRTMIAVGLLQLDLVANDAQSLKEKRAKLQSFKDRLRQRFNVAIAETDHQDLWQRTRLSVVCVANERRPVTAVLSRIVEFVKQQPQFTLLDFEIEDLR